MKNYVLLFAAMVFSMQTIAQNTITIKLLDAKSREPLPGATVTIASLNRSNSTDTAGIATVDNIPNGSFTFEYRYIGYTLKKQNISFPQRNETVLTVLLEVAEEQALDEVRISTTRSSRTIADLPTRIEVIAGEELDEKANMKPGDIRMLLNESTGIQTQQTSATSANASIRIQGLDGRYTQLLKDGFPLYSGAANGLGLLQTPPLDLKQVEVIKGSSSTLYGGGAIAGLVNLITKTPSDEPELHLHLNGTTAGGLDMNGFYAQRYGKAGLTLFAARNSNAAYAPGGVDFTAIPKFTRYTFNPKLFFDLGTATKLSVGFNTGFEDRTGGDVRYIKGNGDATHSFFEQNTSERLSSQLLFTRTLNSGTVLSFKNSVSYFNRRINIPGYAFGGSQYATFSEASVSAQNDKIDWVAGLNLLTDHFNETLQTAVPLRNYRQTTFGAFVQNTVHITEKLELETGLRGDYVADYSFVLLPRISALIKANRKLNSRIGGGLGYKTPTIFTEETERLQYQNVLPISSAIHTLEKSYGVNWDVNYQTTLFANRVAFSVNQLIFYTRLNEPLFLEQNAPGQYRFTNSTGHLDSKGMETNLKFTVQDFKLFAGYSFTDTKIHQGAVLRQNPLTAKHRLNNVLMYEAEDKLKLGAEAYYYGAQTLTDGAAGKPYWTFGFMAEKLWERFSVYINFENFTDTRQTRFDTLYSGTVSNPVFRDIYAPLDGFVVNGGVKLDLR